MPDSEHISSMMESSEAETDESSENGMTLRGAVTRGVLAFVLLYVATFAIGLLAVVLWPNSASSIFDSFRSLMEIALAISSVVIVIGIGVLIIQIAHLVNLLRSEVKPLSEDTRQAVRNVRDTTVFVQDHAVRPIIQAQSLFAGLLAFLREIVQISRMLQKRNDESDESRAGPPE